MIPRLLGALLLAATFPSLLHAVTVEGLYGATVPVVDRSAAENERGIAEAFAQVLVKLTGDSSSATDPKLAKLRRKARSFVTVVGQAEGGSAQDGFRLRVEFDQRAVAAALREAGLEPWPKERPALRTWLAIRDAAGERFSATEEDTPIFDALAARANERGIPLERPPLPALPARSRDGLLAKLVPEGPTAGAPPTLAVLLETTDRKRWTLSWRQMLEGQPIEGKSEGEDPVLLVRQGLDGAIDRLAAHYGSAVAGAGVETISLRLSGLRDAADFGMALKRLRELDVVQKLDITRAFDDALDLRLQARGGLGGVSQGLRLDPAFAAQPDAPATWRFTGATR